MSINNQDSRTLSGLTTVRADILEVPASRRAITINGNFGLAGQTIQKNSDNKLGWGFIDDIEIPDNSITNAKLKDKTIENDKIKDGTIIGSLLAPNLTFTTSGNISANQFIATDKFAQTGTSLNSFNGAIQTTKITTIGGGVDVYNGGAIDLYSDAGTTQTIDIDGATGIIKAIDAKFNEIELPNSGAINVELNSTGIYTLNNKTIHSGGVLEGKTLIINNGDSVSLPAFINGNTTINGDLKSTKFQLPTTGQADDWNVRLTTTGIDTTGYITALGTITGTDGKFNTISVPKTGSPPDVYLSSNGVATASGVAIASGGALSGQSLGITNGQGTAVAVIGGDVDITREFKSSRVGNNTPPIPGATYTEFALNLSDAKGDAFIGRNLICGGTIYGNVEGSITEEVVDCQRLNIRTDPTGATGGAVGATITGTGATLTFVGDAGNTGIDLAQRIIISTNEVIKISGNNGDLTATGNINIGGGGTRTIQVGSTTGSQSYTNHSDTIIIGSTTSLSANTTIGLNGTTTVLVNEKPIRGNGNKLNGIYRNALTLFDMRGDKITHSLNGTQRTTTCLRSDGVRTQLIPNNKSAVISDTGYLYITGFLINSVVATATAVQIHLDTYFEVGTGNPDLYCRIDSDGTKTNTPYPSQTHPHLLKNTAGTSSFNQRTRSTILITGLTVGNNYKFYPRFATTSSATCNFKYGGVFNDALLSYTFLEDVAITDPLAPASDDDY